MSQSPTRRTSSQPAIGAAASAASSRYVFRFDVTPLLEEPALADRVHDAGGEALGEHGRVMDAIDVE